MKTNPLLILGVVLITSSTVYATELARVNNTVITLEDFNRKYKESLKFFQFKAPTKKNVLDDLVKRELALQEAKKINLEKDPEVMERVNTVLYHSLIEKKLSKEWEAIHVTDDEAKSFYQANPEIRTSHIFVTLSPDASSEELKKAKEKISKAEVALKDTKTSFAEVAQRFSEGVAAPMGGDIDYQTRDKLDPVYYETALGLKTPGRTSGVVRTQFGLHIIRLTAVRPWEEVDKSQVKKQVFDKKRSEIFDRYIDQLRKKASVSIKSELLRD